MVNFGTTEKLSKKALFYILLQSLIPVVFFSFFLISYSLYYLILIVFLIFGYAFLFWKFFYYKIETDHITIHSGVVFQQTKVVSFNDLQSINSQFGPILAVFGLRKLKGYTASPEQLVISSSKSGTSVSHKPDIEIILEKQIAEELLQVVRKGDVQKVQNIQSV